MLHHSPCPTASTASMQPPCPHSATRHASPRARTMLHNAPHAPTTLQPPPPPSVIANNTPSPHMCGGDLNTVRVRCARSATIFFWASHRTRNPHFVVLGASLLFDNTYFGGSFASDMAFLGFHPFPPIFAYFHSPHVLLSRFISPHYGSRQCGHSASTSIDLHPASDAIVKVKINMQMTSVQMSANEDQPLDKEQLDNLRMHGGQMCIVCSLS